MVIDFFLFMIFMYCFGYITVGIMDYNYGNSNSTKKFTEKKTLATQDESFINGLIWSDVGNNL